METRMIVNGKIVGRIIDGIYLTPRDRFEHFYRKGDGYPISVSVLESLKAAGVYFIRIIETGRTDGRIVLYEAKVADYDKAAPFQEDKFDLQKCVPLRKLKVLSGKTGGLWDWVLK